MTQQPVNRSHINCGSNLTFSMMESIEEDITLADAPRSRIKVPPFRAAVVLARLPCLPSLLVDKTRQTPMILLKTTIY